MTDTPADAVPRWLLGYLACPTCHAPLLLDRSLVCRAGHRFEVVDGVPRFAAIDTIRVADRLSRETAERFGDQWTQLAEDALVGLDQLRLHLPAGWGPEVLSGRVLDAGCGMGRYTALVAQFADEIVGLDLSRAVDEAHRRWPDLAFIQGDLASPPFDDGTFDVVYSFGVLHHLPEPLRAFETCYRLVRPRGTLLVWVYSDHGGLFRTGRIWARALCGVFPLARVPTAWAGAFFIRLATRAQRASTYSPNPRFAYRSIREAYVDAYDALSAPKEVYVSEQECRQWLASIDSDAKGYERRADGSGWIIWARK
jgi:SAM-dependent methyltransferase